MPSMRGSTGRPSSTGLTDPGAAERWRAVSGSADPEGGPVPQP